MSDRLTHDQRSQNMSRIRSKHTKPEMIVRRMLHSLGFRYRLHADDLPGKPDIVFRSARKVIQVHGCFWHGHEGCARATIPTTRVQFWKAKISANRARDAAALAALHEYGWGVLTVWECQLKHQATLQARLRWFLRK